MNKNLDIENNKEKSIFLVVTWGACGSSWLAKTLNTHPDIFCTHDLAGVLKKSYGTENLSLVGALNLLHGLGDAYSLVGDVHGFTMEEAFELKKIHKKTTIFSLIREPTARAASAVNLMLKYGIQKWGNVEWTKEIAQKNNLPEPKTDFEKAAIYQVMNLNNIESDINADRILKCEDLWNDNEKIYQILNHTVGAPNLDRKIQKTSPTNTHSKNRISIQKIPFQYFQRLLTPKAKELYKGFYGDFT